MAVLELLVARDGERVTLRSPEVGLFTRALPAGVLLGPGTPAGVLHALGRRHELVVPAGVAGRVVSERPERVLAPVDYGAVLYELAPLEASAAAAEARESEDASALVLRAPTSGRVWQRLAPGEPAFASAGDVLEEGRTVALIEVMKTFTQLVYRPGAGLPPRARVVRVLVADGGEVHEGAPLLALEPA